METEEKVLEQAINDDALSQEYLRIFAEAREALWQRNGKTITQCNAACAEVLMRNFSLKTAP